MLLLLLLTLITGIFTYFVIQRSVARFTNKPIWLYWLVIMMPALVMTLWFAIFGESKPMPPLLLLGLLTLCPFVYWWLIQQGRSVTEEKQKSLNTLTSFPTPLPSAIDGSLPLEEESTPSTVRPITAQEEKSLRDCFPWGVYYLQKLDFFPQAIVCRGKLRTNPDVAYQTITENVANQFGDRFLVVFQESLQGQPFFALVPNPYAPSAEMPKTEEKLTRPVLALILVALTLLTTTLMGVDMAGISPKELEANSSLLLRGLPYGLGLITILGIHELSHYFAAIHHKIRTTLPYFIPFPYFLGTFGAFIQIKSPVPHRKALFDIAIAGPLGGFLVTVPLLLWGLKSSGVVQIAANSRLLDFQALDPRFSFLMTVLTKIALGDEFVAGKALLLHPLAIAGYVGLIVTALNLMPIGQLDGGHIIHAIYGQQTAIIVGYVTRGLMICLAFLRPEFLLWAILLFLIPVSDKPTLNDVTELDNRRDILGLLAMGLLLFILLPVPGAVAHWLHV